MTDAEIQTIYKANLVCFNEEINRQYFARAIEAEVRKEQAANDELRRTAGTIVEAQQAEKIAELTRQLEAARKDSEILNEFLTGKPFTVKMKKSIVVYGPNHEAEFAQAFRDAAIKAKEQP